MQNCQVTVHVELLVLCMLTNWDDTCPPSRAVDDRGCCRW